MRLLLVDDHPIVVDALAMSLKLEGLDVEVSPDLDIPAIVERARPNPPDVVLLDLDLDGTDSLPLVRPFVEMGCCVVMVTGERDPVRLGRCIEAGALGIVSKNVPFAKLQETVMDAVSGRTVMAEADRLMLLDAVAQWRREEHARMAPFASLTKRERAVLGHLVDGRTAEEIAAAEFVSLATVRSQIQSILRKLQVNTQLAAVALAKQHRWSPDGDAPAGDRPAG